MNEEELNATRKEKLMELIGDQISIAEMTVLDSAVKALNELNGDDVLGAYLVSATVLQAVKMVRVGTVGMISDIIMKIINDETEDDDESEEDPDENATDDEPKDEAAAEEAPVSEDVEPDVTDEAATEEPAPTEEEEPAPEPVLPVSIDGNPEKSIEALEKKYGIQFPKILKKLYPKMYGKTIHYKPITVDGIDRSATIFLPICGPADLTFEEVTDYMRANCPAFDDYYPITVEDSSHLFAWYWPSADVVYLDLENNTITTVTESVREFLELLI